MQAKEIKVFTPCFEKPPYNSKWWRRKAGGGVSPCIPGEPPYCRDGQSVLANCVGWSWGRMAQLENDPNIKVGCFPGNNYPGNAQNWLNASKQQGFETGMTPKLGAVMVWKSRTGKWGHVANVEAINGDTVTVSESAYNGYYWRNGFYNIRGDKVGYEFLGYIYAPSEWVDHLPEDLKVGDKVRIIAPGNASSYGDSNSAGGIGWERFIYKIYEGRPFPYRVGFMDGSTTGFYKREALEKI